MTIYSNQSQNGTFIDAREFAPLAASTHMFDDEPTDARDGPLAVAVPGFLKGIDKASSQFGSLDFSDLFDEVIEMAEYSELNHFTATAIEENSDYCSNYPDLSNIYCQDSSTPKNEVWKEKRKFFFSYFLCFSLFLGRCNYKIHF